MINPPTPVSASLNRLKQSPDGEVIIGWLMECLDAADIRNRTATGEALARSQGEAITLAELLTHIERASEYVRVKAAPRKASHV